MAALKAFASFVFSARRGKQSKFIQSSDPVAAPSMIHDVTRSCFLAEVVHDVCQKTVGVKRKNREVRREFFTEGGQILQDAGVLNSDTRGILASRDADGREEIRVSAAGCICNSIWRERDI